jgi:hypothetical protein
MAYSAAALVHAHSVERHSPELTPLRRAPGAFTGSWATLLFGGKARLQTEPLEDTETGFSGETKF